MKIIGLDVGEKRIGVAKVDSSTRIAVPIGFLDVNGLEWQEIAHIANINNTNFFVVGLPRSNEGNETAQSLYARNFAKTLAEKIPGSKIRLQDESLTSVMAEERLKQRGKKFEKGDIDAEAAAIILQDFVENFTVKSATQELNPANTVGSDTRAGNLVTGVKATVNDARETASAMTKREADKLKMATKKAKHKMKTATKWISAIIILVILGLLAVGAAFIIKEQRYKEYAEYFAEQEANMKAEVFNFTIRPGETIRDIKNNLMKQGYTSEEIEQAFNDNYDYAFLKERPEGASLEGYLYGETYEFYEGETVKEILNTFLSEMGKVITDNNLTEKYANQGLTLYEGITLASIVQKEAPSPEQPTVAQVFLKRLSYGIPLGSDVTVSYALDQVDPDRKTYVDNQSALKVDSCYNTRVYPGIPCGPISNPGLSALLAVANPSDTAYLYFLTGDDGMMYYSDTEYGHIQNIRIHCQELCNVSL